MLSISLLFFTLFVIFLLKIFSLIIQERKFFKKIQHISGPKGLPLIGNALEFRTPEDFLPKLMNYYHQYGPNFRIKLGLDNFVFTADPKTMEGLLVSNKEVNKSEFYRFAKNWIGDGLLLASNPRWKIHRKIITPAFHFNILKDFLPVFHKHADRLVDCWKKEVKPFGKTEKNISHDLEIFALDIICETAMGISVSSLDDKTKSNYTESISYMGKTIMERTFSFWKQFDSLYQFSSTAQKEKKMTKIIRGTSKKIIQQKRKELENKTFSNGTSKQKETIDDDIGGKKRIAFLDLLLEMTNDNGSNFTDEELREEVDNFIFAGHETTATTVSYILYILAKYPDIQEKVYNEIMEVLNGDAHMDYDNLSNLKYLEMVIKETLRLYPIGPMFFRQLTEDCTFNGVFYPKDLVVAVFTYAAHRNPKIYEDPERFDPERFTAENSTKRNPFAYVPFSAGPRNCLGQRYAIMEMKCLLSAIIPNFKFSPSSNEDIKPCAVGLLKSLNGVNIKMELR